MGKRGPKPKGKVPIVWSSRFAYGIGLIASDGNLSPNGRHINFTTTDTELVELFQASLGITASVTMKRRGDDVKKDCLAVQFSDVLFYEFLNSIGITRRKSKTIQRVLIPRKFFFDFLRGVFDGDGSTHSYYDPRWKSSFMFYTIFASASQNFIDFIRNDLYDELSIKGHVTQSRGHSVLQLKYAKQESVILLRALYANTELKSLSRKRLKIQEMLRIIDQRL